MSTLETQVRRDSTAVQRLYRSGRRLQLQHHHNQTRTAQGIQEWAQGERKGKAAQDTRDNFEGFSREARKGGGGERDQVRGER